MKGCCNPRQTHHVSLGKVLCSSVTPGYIMYDLETTSLVTDRKTTRAGECHENNKLNELRGNRNG